LKLGNFEPKDEIEGLHEINERLEIKEDDEHVASDIDEVIQNELAGTEEVIIKMRDEERDVKRADEVMTCQEAEPEEWLEREQEDESSKPEDDELEVKYRNIRKGWEELVIQLVIMK
jgi:hypothetical protein